MNEERNLRSRRYRHRKKSHGFLKCLLILTAVLFLLSDASPVNLTFPNPVSLLTDYLPGRQNLPQENAGTADDAAPLPAAFDLRDSGRAPLARSQGNLGTCWAFSRLTAVESALLPDRNLVLSPDHMSIHCPGTVSQYDGGTFNTADAYLLSWSGPVTEEEDPYGDGYSPDGLKPVLHVQGIRYFPEKDYNAIKRAVMKYGGVVSSICIPVESDADSEYYNHDRAAFCYNGDLPDNHDAVIIGWDDNYPASGFNAFAKQNGAFLVLSSWGDRFGEKGVFRVSYDDQYIGKQSEAYADVEDTGNYDRICQSDLWGETASMGYNRPFTRFANVYTADSSEEIAAVGMYATGRNMRVKIYTVADTGGRSPWLWKRHFETEACFTEEGYYTVPLPKPVAVGADRRFAVMAEVAAAETNRPVAIEYGGENGEYKIDLNDGEGYISCLGSRWYSAERDYGCNLCLKAYMKKR